MATRDQTAGMVHRARYLARRHLELATDTAAFLREWTAGDYSTTINNPILNLDDIIPGLGRADIINAVTTFIHLNGQVANGHDTNLAKAAQPE